MATIQHPSPTAQTPVEQPSTFPAELPERPPQKATRAGIRNCLSLNFLRSYSLRRTTNARTTWRRIAMLLTLIVALVTAGFGLAFSWANIAELIVFTILDFFFFWALCWSLAVNGDAVGSRKVLGINWNRNVLDGVIYGSLFLYVFFFLIWLFLIGSTVWQAFWLSLTAVNIAVAWIASEPPYQGY